MKRPFTSCLCKPMLTSMVMDQNVQDCIVRVRHSVYDGADVIAFHLEFLNPQYHTYKDLKRIFTYAGNLPIYTMHYRNAARPESTEEELVRVQLIAAEAGASMVDVMGDIFEPSDMQLAKSDKAIDRQKRMIDQFHQRDCEVMFSSHTWKFMTAEQTLEHCHELIRRGADMVKIAMCAFQEDQMDEVYRTTRMMQKELTVPFLHVCMGQYGKLHRIISPMFGSALVLCMQEYTPISNKEQPLLRATRTVYDNIDWTIARNDQMGCFEEMPDEK